METVGILKSKTDTQVVSDKFKKRELVLTLEASTPYPQHVSFQLSQDKCGLADSLNIGDEVKVLFNIKGREWTSPQGEVKYFNTLEAWKLEKVGGAKSSASNPTQSGSVKTNVKAQVQESSTIVSSSQDEDLPF